MDLCPLGWGLSGGDCDTGTAEKAKHITGEYLKVV